MKPLLRLLAVALAAALGSAARAQVVTPQPPPTIITTAPYTITAPGYYQLGANLTISNTTGAIITINAGNVTLDFAGHYISGPSNSAAIDLIGVNVNDKGNVNIRNGTIAYCLDGIYLAGDTSSSSPNINQRIDNMLVTYCYRTGVYLYYARNSAVSGCRISFTGGSTIDSYAYGINSQGGSGNVFMNNVVNTVTSSNGGAYGIYGGSYAANNLVSKLSSTGGASGIGLYTVKFAVGNTVDTATYGLYFCGKYKDNLTYGCTTPFSGGTAVGSDNN